MNNNTKNTLIGATAIVIAAIIGFLGVWFTHDKKIAAGKIQVPMQGATVENKFTTKGILQNIPNGKHVWLAIKVDDNIWPKKEINKDNRAWTEIIEEYGDTREFSLIIFIVDQESNIKINKWIKEREQGNYWSPIDKNIETKILDAVILKLKK